MKAPVGKMLGFAATIIMVMANATKSGEVDTQATTAQSDIDQ